MSALALAPLASLVGRSVDDAAADQLRQDLLAAHAALRLAEGVAEVEIVPRDGEPEGDGPTPGEVARAERVVDANGEEEVRIRKRMITEETLIDVEDAGSSRG